MRLLVRVPDALTEAEALALAFVGADRLIVQRRDRVQLVDLDGHERSRWPAAGTRLRGVVAARYAIFEGYFPATHPMLAEDDPAFGPDPEVDGRGHLVSPTLGEISVLDCEEGVYLERPPPGVALCFITNDRADDLFLSDEDGAPVRRVRAGGDRPTVLAYTPGMSHAWVGEEGTAILDLDANRPYVFPSEPMDEVPRWGLLPAADEGGERDEDERVSAIAAAFHDGTWRLLWSSGVLCDHRARDAVRLHPPPEAAAFDPTGRTLALVVAGSVVIADVDRRVVLRRFDIPPT